MFFRVKPSGPRRYLQLVENTRDGTATRQRVLATLGRIDDAATNEKLDALLESGARFSDTALLISSLQSGTLETSATVRIGAPLIFGRLWQQTGCAAVIAQFAADRGFGVSLERAVFASVLHRLMVSGSDRHASRWQQSVQIPGAEALTLESAYKAMAWLGEMIKTQTDRPRYRSEAIEEALYHHRKSLFGELSVAFFDTTSLYFEGRGGATLGQHGHSKDYRPQLHQVVLGVVLDEADRPIASFLWPGNTADVTTLPPVVERLRRRFGVTRACVVADRGMISAATLAALQAQGIDYILGVRERSSREVRDTVLVDDGVAVSWLPSFGFGDE
jgi:hypothetical protein